MKLKHLIFYSTFTALLVVSCAKEREFIPVEEEEQLIPLNIEGTIKQVATRATAEGFVDKDAVGLFAVNYSENNTIAGTLALEGNQADNVKYVFDEPNQKWTPVRPVYYKNINTNVDLYLYYPHRAEINDINAASFEVQKDQSVAATATTLSGYEASDWMWGKQENVTPQESKVRIPLSHRLSAVQLTLGEGSGFAEGEFANLDKSVLLTGTTRKATLDFATGVATPIGTAQLDGIVMCPQTDGSFRAVVIPQTVEAGVKLFAITIGGVSYPFSQSEDIVYEQGKQANVSINVNKKTASGEYELVLTSTQIVDWTEDLNSHGGEARQYYVVNVETPGTLGDLITAAGKNPDKIKNLKVTGNVNSDDFYFMRDNMAILEAVNMKEVSLESINYVIPHSAFRFKKSLTYFVFPEIVKIIDTYSFLETNLSGHLSLPNTVETIGVSAFSSTLISGVTWSKSLKEIKDQAFLGCSSLTGDLILPESITSIGGAAFNNCEFNGRLHLPEHLETIGYNCFGRAGTFVGDLIIPERVKNIPQLAFNRTQFKGRLQLSNVQTLAEESFYSCGFTGDLVIPEGIIEIPRACFAYNSFRAVSFPSSLKQIELDAICNNSITYPVTFPEGLITIGQNALGRNPFLPSIILPSTLQTIGIDAFKYCYGLSGIISNSVEAPTVQSGAFDGVAKDNFTVKVPTQSVKRYQAEAGWSDFKRIAAHYDFSVSRDIIRALNGSITRTYILRVPANFSWSIQEKPDWITVEPTSGTGKTDVTITVDEMAAGDVGTFEVNEGTFNNPSYKTYSGRAGEIVFLLNDKDYTTSISVEQYHFAHPDGYVQTLQSATKGSGIDIVFTGDGYDAKDIAKGTFIANAEEGYGHFFDVEPYKTYKDYFNVYAVIAMSDESGIGTVNTLIDTKFGSTFTQNRILLENHDEVFNWSKKADASMDLSKSLVILLQNTSTYEGVTYMYTNGSAIACCPVSQLEFPYDFRGIIQHEAGGHGFGKLGDEYIYHNAFIQNCDCIDKCDHPQSDSDTKSSYGVFKSLGWYKNLSMTSDATRVPWAHLIYHPQYSEYVDIYEGGYMHSRGIYRSEATSCMNNNIPYYSAISRQAIVERIKECAGEEFTLEDFYANDDDSFGPTTRSGNHVVDRTFGVDPKFFLATGEGPILVGDHPSIK